MKRLLILTTALAGVAAGAWADDKKLNVLSWGGAYGQSHLEAYFKPFEAATGAKVVVTDADNPATPVKAQVEAGNVSADVASVEYADAVRLCDEGALEEIDAASLTPAPDGTAAADDFLDGTVTECFVATDLFSVIYAYDRKRFADQQPTTLADFFDTATFPGKRALRKTPRTTLEMALMADGVPAGEVYQVLSTPEGVDRAFAKLDTIKKDAIWWDAGAQPPQLLADGEVALAMAYNGRIFNANIVDKQDFVTVWDGQVYEMEGWVIPKGAPNADLAREFISFSTGTEPLAHAAEWISYGPPRKSSSALVGTFKGGEGKEGADVEMKDYLPTAHMENALASDTEFWVDHASELTERFNAWLVAN